MNPLYLTFKIAFVVGGSEKYISDNEKCKNISARVVLIPAVR